MDGRGSQRGLNRDVEVNVALLNPPQVPRVGDPRTATIVRSPEPRPYNKSRAIVSDVKDSEYRISTSLAHQDSLHPDHRSY